MVAWWLVLLILLDAFNWWDDGIWEVKFLKKERKKREREELAGERTAGGRTVLRPA